MSSHTHCPPVSVNVYHSQLKAETECNPIAPVNPSVSTNQSCQQSVKFCFIKNATLLKETERDRELQN